MRSKRAKPEKKDDVPADLPATLRRRVRASAAILAMQEGAAQVRNDANRPLRAAHEALAKLPGTKELREAAKESAAAVMVGRAKQVQYAIDDAVAMMASYRSNFFGWVADKSSRPGKPRPPGFFRRGQRVGVTFDYQDFKVRRNRVHMPASCGMDTISLVGRDGRPLLGPGDDLVMVRIEPCRSRKWIDATLVIRRAKAAASPVERSGSLLVDLGVARLVTCLDDRQLVAWSIDGEVAKAILHRGAKWHAKLRSEAKLGARHGKARAGALAARSGRQMADLMKKVARLVVEYAIARGLKRVVVGRNVNWKQHADMGGRQNQLFTFIPHGKLIEAIKAKCARASIEFIETEESYTSKTDHLAHEPMGEKPEGYRWLGTRSHRGCFRSSMGIVLQADVNGCIGIARKVGGKKWLEDFLRRLGAAPGTRLVPRKVYVNGAAPVQGPGPEQRYPRLLSPRAWISTKVALAMAELIPDHQRAPSGSDGDDGSYPQGLSAAA